MEGEEEGPPLLLGMALRGHPRGQGPRRSQDFGRMQVGLMMREKPEENRRVCLMGKDVAVERPEEATFVPGSIGALHRQGRGSLGAQPTADFCSRTCSFHLLAASKVRPL